MRNKKYLKILLSFWKYKKGSSLNGLNSSLGQTLNTSNPIYILENGRTAEYLFLKSLNLPEGSEVIVQGFTCNAVINPILWLNLKPIYLDIDPETLNLDISDLKSKISDKTRVIIVQHTFGNPFDLSQIQKISSDKGIYILEDCAHALGIKSNNAYLGTSGDASIYSFGIEKILSSRVGGALLINNLELKDSIDCLYDQLPVMNFWDTFLWLLNPLIWRILRSLRNPEIAKKLNKMKLLDMGFAKCEKIGVMPFKYPRRLSNALSEVVMVELSTLTDNLNHRLKLSKLYTQALLKIDSVKIPKVKEVSPNIRFPVILKSKDLRQKIKLEMENLSLPVGDWYCPVIYPGSTNLQAMLYNGGDCSVAESISKRIINLPTGKNITELEAKRIIEIIKQYAENSD